LEAFAAAAAEAAGCCCDAAAAAAAAELLLAAEASALAADAPAFDEELLEGDDGDCNLCSRGSGALSFFLPPPPPPSPTAEGGVGPARGARNKAVGRIGGEKLTKQKKKKGQQLLDENKK